MLKNDRKTKVVLKKPKTESSIRRIWLPKTLALILREWKEEQDAYKEYFGNEYYDYMTLLYVLKMVNSAVIQLLEKD